MPTLQSCFKTFLLDSNIQNLCIPNLRVFCVSVVYLLTLLSKISCSL
ncbi:hypothetical protein CKA32_000383 [Geitlerinema sp. FC II]|nr:hypothetical protein CKA32_000383 [Geitlerinema sp. FC II]